MCFSTFAQHLEFAVQLLGSAAVPLAYPVEAFQGLEHDGS